MRVARAPRSYGQGIELLGGRRTAPLGDNHLPFADHPHGLDATEDDASAAKILEPLHRPDPAFDATVVLLNEVIQILVLPDLDRRFPLSIDRLHGREVRATLVHRDGLWRTVLGDGLFEEAPGSGSVSARAPRSIGHPAG
ncbi:hypothetical protein QF001_000658 [Paraburkholderia youngii]